MRNLFVLLNLLTIFCLPLFAQKADKNLLKTIRDYYRTEHFECCILNSEGKWYFVSAVDTRDPYSRSWYDERIPSNMATKDKIKWICDENVKMFFQSKPEYSKYTRYPANMDNIENLEYVYEKLSRYKQEFYSMPLIGKGSSIKALVTDVYFFAKALTDGATVVSRDAKRSQYRTNSFSRKSNNEDNNKDVLSDKNGSITLVAFGSGTNKEEAIKNALREALEQTYGTFVSSNTQLVNDELVKDDIVSVSSGNIEKYSVLSTEDLKDGRTSVNLKATISIGRLIEFAKSKGASTELAGATFAINMKIKKLNKENEVQALNHLFEKLFRICENNLFDYKITNEQPILTNPDCDNDSSYSIFSTIYLAPNNNYENLLLEFANTLKSLSLSDSEIREYITTNIPFYVSKRDIVKDLDDLDANYRLRRFGYLEPYPILEIPYGVALRNDIFKLKDSKGNILVNVLKEKIAKSAISFQITDNLGNRTIPTICTNRCGPDRIFLPFYNEGHTGRYTYGASIKTNSHNFYYSKIRKHLDNYHNFILFTCEQDDDRHHDFSNCLRIKSINQTSFYLEYKESELAKLQYIKIIPIPPSEVIFKDNVSSTYH